MRIVIAEDAVLLRAGLTRLLDDAGEEVVAAVGDPVALFDVLARQQPDLAILDVRMPPTFTDEGIRAAVRIREEHPQVAVLVLSQYVEKEYATELLAGNTESVGYLLKDRVADVDDFAAAVRRVAQGGSALDPAVVGALVSPARDHDPLRGLTAREREVLALVAEGKSNSAISAQLVVAERTIETHMRAIFQKLGLHDSDDTHRRVLAVLAYLTRLGAADGSAP